MAKQPRAGRTFVTNLFPSGCFKNLLKVKISILGTCLKSNTMSISFGLSDSLIQETSADLGLEEWLPSPGSYAHSI